MKWIPCYESLPPDSGTYLVTTPEGEVSICFYSTLYGWQGWIDMIAWAELPKPYKF